MVEEKGQGRLREEGEIVTGIQCRGLWSGVAVKSMNGKMLSEYTKYLLYIAVSGKGC